MRFELSPRGPLPLVLALFFVVSATQSLAGQQVPRPRDLDRVQFGIGYMTSLPHMAAGAGGYVVTPWGGGWGIYVDAKFDIESPENTPEFEPRLTAQQVYNQITGAVPLQSESSWQSFNAAVVRSLNPYLSVYVGGGLARKNHFREFEDPNRDTDYGRGGVMWVEAPDEDENRANIMAGLIMRLTSRFSSHFGWETQPMGVTAGLSLRLPAW